MEEGPAQGWEDGACKGQPCERGVHLAVLGVGSQSEGSGEPWGCIKDRDVIRLGQENADPESEFRGFGPGHTHGGHC